MYNITLIVCRAECPFFSLRGRERINFRLYIIHKGAWNTERAFQISWKKKAEIPKGGLNDDGIPKAWVGGGG